MKIVDRKTFLAMPPDTLYSKYEPCFFGDLEIKGYTAGTNDFVTQQIVDAVRCNDSNEFFDILLDAQKTGASFAMDFDCASRDGLFDDAELFAVWEQADVIALIRRLIQLL